MLSTQEQIRNDKIRKALANQIEQNKGAVEARRFLMRLGCWNEDGTLKEEWGGKPSALPNKERLR